jgi:hypothetical protein
LAQETRDKLTAFAFAVLVALGLLIMWANKNEIRVTPSFLFELGMVSAAFVGGIVALCVLIRLIWIEHGDDIVKALGQWLIRLFRL